MNPLNSHENGPRNDSDAPSGLRLNWVDIIGYMGISALAVAFLYHLAKLLIGGINEP
jgi:hypothetical protein